MIWCWSHFVASKKSISKRLEIFVFQMQKRHKLPKHSRKTGVLAFSLQKCLRRLICSVIGFNHIDSIDKKDWHLAMNTPSSVWLPKNFRSNIWFFGLFLKLLEFPFGWFEFVDKIDFMILFSKRFTHSWSQPFTIYHLLLPYSYQSNLFYISYSNLLNDLKIGLLLCSSIVRFVPETFISV